MSAIDELLPRVEPRRTVAYANKADLDELLRHARERGEVVLYVPGEGRVELTRIPGSGSAGEAPEHERV